MKSAVCCFGRATGERGRPAWLVAMAKLALFFLWAAPARAHETDLFAAQVTLRDDHAKVVVEIDILELVARTSLPRVPDARELARASDATLEAHLLRAREALQRGARLDADGSPVELELSSFPEPKEVRAVALKASAAVHEHGALLPVRFEARRPVPDARTISVALPGVPGSVLYTFAQPATSVAPPGSSASFNVLAPSAADHEAVVAAAPLPSSWLIAAACVLAAAALLGALLPRRSKLEPPLAPRA